MFFAINTNIDDFDIDEALSLVSPQRRSHALRYHSVRDRRLSLAAYRLLQGILKEEYGIVQPPRFSFGENGKPVLQDHPEIFFNFSHCHDAAACVVSDSPVGIDVECLDSYDVSLLESTMSDEEQRQILQSADPRLTFIRLWTVKESLLKMTGQGIVTDLRTVLSDHHPSLITQRPTFHTTHYPTFVCTVCCQSDK